LIQIKSALARPPVQAGEARHFFRLAWLAFIARIC
jgi:hypothetical protein